MKGQLVIACLIMILAFSSDSGFAAEVKNVALFHHEPVRSDEALDAIAASAQEHAKAKGSATNVFCAEESKEMAL